MRAVENQNQWTAPIVDNLLDNGANVDFKYKDGLIALHHAAGNQSKYTVDVMKILVKHKSKVNDKN